MTDFDIACDLMGSVYAEAGLEFSRNDYELVWEGREHLVKKVITDKRGHKRTVWINPNKGKPKQKAEPKPKAAAKPAAKPKATPKVKAPTKKAPSKAGTHEVYKKINDQIQKSDIPDGHKQYYSEVTNAVLGAMPKALQDRIAEGTKGATFYQNKDKMNYGAVQQVLDDYGSKLDDKTVALLKKRQSEPGRAGGIFHLYTGQMHLDGHDIQGADAQSAHSVYSHEMMHAADAVGGKFTLSGTTEWKNIAISEIGQEGYLIDSTPLTEYAQVNPHEAFAEFGRVLYTQAETPLAEIEKTMPQASAYFKKLGFWPTEKQRIKGPSKAEIFDQNKRFNFGSDNIGHIDTLRQAS